MPSIDSSQIVPGTGEVVYSNTTETPTSSQSSQSSSSNQQSLNVIGSNIGAGVGLYAGVMGSSTIDLQFKSLIAGQNVILTPTNNSVEISCVPSIGQGSGQLPTPYTLNGLVFASNGTTLSFIEPPTNGSNQCLSWNGSNFVWGLVNNNLGTVENVTIASGSSPITVSGSPITSSGTYVIGLAPSGVSAGTYTTANLSVDTYGRVTSITNGSASGSNGVTSVSMVAANAGVTVSGSPITTSGTFSVGLANSGVTAGSYSSANVTVDSFGRITAISNSAAASIPTPTANGLLYGASGSTYGTVPAPSASNQVLTWNGTSFVWTTPSTGGSSGITTISSTTSTIAGALPVVASVTATSASFANIAATNPLQLALSSDKSTLILSLGTSGVAPGTYNSVTVDSFGRVTSGSNQTSGGGNVVGNAGYMPALYTFNIELDGNGNIAGYSNLPPGWTATLPSENIITLTHNLGRFPIYVSGLGANFTGTGATAIWNLRPVVLASPSMYSVGVDTTATTTIDPTIKPNSFTIYGLNASNLNAAVSATAIYQVLI